MGDLAKSFEYKSPKEIIFKLRDNVLWHDGKEFTADDVIFTFNLLNSKKISTPYSSDLRRLRRSWKRIRIKLPLIKRINLIKEGTLFSKGF